MDILRASKSVSERPSSLEDLDGMLRADAEYNAKQKLENDERRLQCASFQMRDNETMEAKIC
jgi:hypothetical protein